MIYSLFWPMTKLGCLLYFRKIFLINKEHVPRKGPLMIVCNHPSSFMEPCLLAVLLPRPLYYLTRGDFFKKGIFSWLLRQTHQIPIFRMEDGFDKLRTNQDTFAFCYQALGEGKTIVIFPETRTETEKRLRPVQKGPARIAVNALAQLQKDSLNILPIGVTFNDPTKFQRPVTVRCGEVMSVTAPDDGADERDAIVDITNRIEEALRSLIIEIKDPQRETLFDEAQILLLNDLKKPGTAVVIKSPQFVGQEIALAQHINDLSEDNFTLLSGRMKAYSNALKSHGLTDRFLQTRFYWSFIGKLLLPVITVLMSLGKLITALPASMIHHFLNRKIRRIPFYGPLKWAMGTFGYGLWFALLLLLGWVIAGRYGILATLFLTLASHLFLQYFHDMSIKGMLAPITLPGAENQKLKQLRSSVTMMLTDTQENIVSANAG